MRSRRHKTVIIRKGGNSGRNAFVGGLLGGVMGGVIAGAMDNDAPAPAPSSSLDKLMKYVSAAPVGATVKVTMTEFRLLVDKGLITYSGTTPHCMDRVIEVK